MQAQTIQTGHIMANGYNFTYLETGKGPLVLLFHGFPDNPYSFTSQLKALAAAGYHAVAPYKRGFEPGDAPISPVQHSALYMQDAVAIVEAFKEEKVILIGHDWPDWQGYKEHLQSVKQTFSKKGLAEAAVEYYRQSFGDYQLTDPELQKIQGAFYDNKPFTAPTLYLHGQNDGCIGVENAAGMEQLFSGKFEKHIIPGAGHFVQLEKPDIVNNYILQFLNSLK